MRFGLRHTGLAALAVGTVACGWVLGSLGDPPTTLNFLSVGQGDCTVVISRGHTILIDSGPATPYENAGEKIVVPWLRQHGVDQVDAIFLSHPDGDHVGGTPAVLKAYPEARVVISDQFEADPAMLGHLKTWGLPVNAVDWIPRFSVCEIGDLHAFIDCPDRSLISDTNDGSMFVRLSEGKGSATFSGDAPKEVEKKMEPDTNWNSEIVHVGHHGSHTATDPTWLAATRPRFAIVSVGRQNRYGLPYPGTLKRLEDANISVLRTDREGTITFVFNGTEFERE